MAKHRQTPSGMSPAAVLERPRLAADVRLHEPVDPDGSWFLQRGEHQYFRVTADLARLAATLDGHRDPEALADRLGSPWRPTDVRGALRQLQSSQVLDDGRRRKRPSRFRFVPPFTLQLRLVDPQRLLGRLAGRARALTTPAAGWAVVAVIAAGLLALAAQADELIAALSQPLPLTTYGALLAGILATTAIHELGHGVTLAAFGGRPNRMGVMLFYLSPAFFCDVSDGWRLPRSRQRVVVALAGIATQWVIAGVVAVGAALVPDPQIHRAMLLFAAMTLIAGLANAIPFIKLDGYIALMCHLDIPHLRDRAIGDARQVISRILFGGRVQRSLPQPWAVPFGLACLAFPVLIVGNGLLAWSDLLARTGIVGALLLSAVFAAIGYYLVRGLVRLIRTARRSGARPARIVAVLATAAALVLTALLTVPVPQRVNGGFVAEHGTVRLIVPAGTDTSAIPAGSPVTLYHSGLVTRTHVAEGTVDAAWQHTEAPLSTLVPITDDVLDVSVQAADITTIAPVADGIGTAQIEIGDVSALHWALAAATAPLRG